MALALLLTNLIIAICYYAIAGLVGAQLLRARDRGRNPLGVATAGIFFTCALGHSVHVVAFLMTALALMGGTLSASGAAAAVRWLCDLGVAPEVSARGMLPVMGSPAVAQLLADSITVLPAIGFLALRRRYGLLVDGESVILDYERTLAVERVHLAERTASLAAVEERARELAEARAAAERAHQAALRATEALRISESFQRTIVETAPIGIATLGEAGAFQTVNPTLCALLGSDAEALVGRSFRSCVAPDDQLALDPWANLISADPSRTLRTELRLLHHDGHQIWVTATLTTLQHDADTPTARLLILEDLTQRRAMEEERLRIERGLLEAQRLESLGVLAGGIAHDFNNILTSILGHAELVALDLGPRHPAQPGLEQVRQGSLRAAELIHQLLAYAGKGRFSISYLQLSELVREMAELMHVSLGPHARLATRLAPELPRVAADVVQLRQVLLNLLTNGAEAIGPEGGTVTISTELDELGRGELTALVPTIQLAPGPYVRLTVSDTGHGMDEAVLQRIFDPFFTTKFTGRGLGLSAVQGIVRSHHGALAVESTPGGGTTFRIWLPVATVLPAPAVARPIFASGGGTLLIIDDEEPVRVVLGQMLASLGYSVLSAADGGAGLALLNAGVADLRGVLIDLTMPGMSGVEVAEQLATLRPGVPVTLMSGYSAAEIAERRLPANVISLLQKPYTIDQVRVALSSLPTRASDG